MDQKITKKEIIEIVNNSDLDKTIKQILIRDIEKEGINEFLLDQVIAYCDNAVAVLQKYQAS